MLRGDQNAFKNYFPLFVFLFFSAMLFTLSLLSIILMFALTKYNTISNENEMRMMLTGVNIIVIHF